MAEVNVHGLPNGVHVLWCDGVPVAVHKDPATMTPLEKEAICKGQILEFTAKNVTLRKREDGHFEADVKAG